MGKQMKGVLGEKLGMTQVWDENSKLVPVTVVKAGPCVVTQVRTADADGYATPGRVFKGMRMSGRMGNVRQTTQNLTVHAVDAEKGLLLVKGAVPGPVGGLVLVRTAAKGA